MLVAIRLRAKSVSQAFLTVTYIGELAERGPKGEWHLKNTGIVYETLEQKLNNQTRQPFVDIVTKFYTHSGVTNGTIVLRDEDVLWSREVEKDDEFLVGYNDALEAFRLEKLRLVKSGVLPMNARPPGDA